MVTRRDFFKLAAALGASVVISKYKVDIVNVFAQARDYIHICWLNGASCTGCSISFAQAMDPDIVEILTSITVGNSRLPIALPDWMYVIHPAAGTLAVDLIKYWIKHESPNPKILVVEGAVQKPGFCETGGRDFRDWVRDCAEVADYIVSFGSCASFGGIPHAKGNATGAMGVQKFLKEIGRDDLARKVINLPRCPGHPHSLVITLAGLIEGVTPELDKYNRPKAFYGWNMHSDLCPYRPYFEKEDFCKFGQSESGCRYKIGCKGPITWTDCPLVKWNGISYCVEAGAPCIGCSEPEWPDGDFAPFFGVLPISVVTGPSVPAPKPTPPPLSTMIGTAAIAAAAGGAITYAATRATRGGGEKKKSKKEGGE